MNKIDKLIRIAQEKIPPQPAIDFSFATTDELLELINDATTKERFHEIVYALMDRAGKGELWHSSD